MREIKFRIKNNWDGQWEYFNWHYSESFACDLGNCDKETLGQFTGLYDKNGTEIYEGDVYEVSGFILARYVVTFQNGSFCGGLTKKENAPLGWDIHETFGEIIKDEDMFEYIEVIGNIHESPGLIKE